MSEANNSISIGSQDVIRLILQFLKENNLVDSMKELQLESGVTLNTVDDIEAFLSDIRYGKWDSVLQQVSALRLPSEKLSALYEQVVFELLETGERDLCKELLATAEPLLLYKITHPERYARLEVFCKRPFFNASDVYEMGQTKDSKRLELASMLQEEVMTVNPSRLLTLLGDAVRYHNSVSSLPQPFDLFRGQKRNNRRDMEERIAKHFSNASVRSASGQKVSTLSWSTDGASCILGCVEGGMEVWDEEVLALRKDLDYQQQSPMSIGVFILSVALSKDGDHCALGAVDGSVRVVRLSTGAVVRSFPTAHTGAVNSVIFSKDNSHILTGSQDCTAHILGLRSGKTLKEFRGHSSYVTSAIFTRDNLGNVLTSSADGSVRLWDGRTTECFFTYRPGALQGKDFPVLHVLPTCRADHYAVCTRSNAVFIISSAGQEVATLTNGKGRGAELVACTASPQGRYLYGAAEDGQMYIFDLKLGVLEEVVDMKIPGQPSSEAALVVHHPQRNLVAVLSRLGELSLLQG